MQISDYSYDLPKNRIAQIPPKVRGTSRLLVLNRQNGELEQRRYGDLYKYLRPGDLVVLNDTRVIKARLVASNSRGQTRELLLLEEHSRASPYQRLVVYRGKIIAGEELKCGAVKLTVLKILSGGLARIKSSANLLKLAETAGQVPLPPYMNRHPTASDARRYQTIFARRPGSVAAPTASLNFTKALERKMLAKKVEIAYLTLHVGLGTFLPIREQNLVKHRMHSEYYEISEASLNKIRNTKLNGGRIVAIGTTVVRTLEATANKILSHRPLADLKGEAKIFIYPGYKFKLVDVLVTNFHAPKSTVLMLTAAFAGWPNLKPAYETAVKEKYAFLSYGDSMFIY